MVFRNKFTGQYEEPDERLMRLAYQAQAYSVIPKPVSKHVVLYTVVRALGRRYGGGRG